MRRLAFLAILIGLLSSCSASQVPQRALSNEANYECVSAEDDSWNCEEVDQQPEPQVATVVARPATRSRTATRQTTQVETASPQPQETETQERQSRGFGIRLRRGSPETADNDTSTEELKEVLTPVETSVEEPQVAVIETTEKTEEAPAQRRAPRWLRLRSRNTASEREEASPEPEPAAPEVVTPTRVAVIDFTEASSVDSEATTEAAAPSSASSAPESPISVAVSNAMNSSESEQTPSSSNIPSQPGQSQPATSLEQQLQNSSSYIVQLAAFKSESRARVFMSQYPLLNLSKLRILSNSQVFHIVISGVFPTRSQAQLHSGVIQETYTVDRPYIRSVASIQPLLN